jgi:hypothetical protein
MAACRSQRDRYYSNCRAWCCRQTSASTRGSLRRPIPASRRSFSPGSIPAKRRAADAAGEPVTVPAGSTLVVRATGKLHLDVAGSGGVTTVNEATHAPSGTEEHRFKIAATGTATLRGVGDDQTWAFNATPHKPPTIALTKDPEQQNRGAMLLSYRVEDDYGATEAHATFARKDEPAAKGDGPASAVRAARFLAGPAAGAHQERRRADHQGRDRSSLGRRRGGHHAHGAR